MDGCLFVPSNLKVHTISGLCAYLTDQCEQLASFAGVVVADSRGVFLRSISGVTFQEETVASRPVRKLWKYGCDLCDIVLVQIWAMFSKLLCILKVIQWWNKILAISFSHRDLLKSSQSSFLSIQLQTSPQQCSSRYSFDVPSSSSETEIIFCSQQLLG